MGNFARLLPFILQHEGVDPVKNPTGFADIPGDPGGVTQWGISQRAYMLMRAKNPTRFSGYPANVIELNRSQAEVIYRWEYWDTIPAHGLPDTVALVVFDAAVNQGPGTAVQVLQRALAVKDDGDFGQQSQAALARALAGNGPDAVKLREEVLWQRLAEYQRDTARDVSQARMRGAGDSAFPRFFVNLWVPRLFKCRQEAAAITTP